MQENEMKTMLRLIVITVLAFNPQALWPRNSPPFSGKE